MYVHLYYVDMYRDDMVYVYGNWKMVKYGE
jgi:hypothetical protein